jgi:hypothetical protein
MNSTLVSVESGQIRVLASFADMLLVQRLGGRFLGASRAWVWPATPENARLLQSKLRAIRTTPEFDSLVSGAQRESASEPFDASEITDPSIALVPVAGPEPEIAIPAGMLTPPWRHQKAAFKFCSDHFAAGFHGILLAMGMGCVEGDAELIVNRCSCARRIVLREFHRKFHGGESNGRRWRDLPTRSRSMIDGEFRLNKVLDVIAQGVKPVVRVTLHPVSRCG